MSLKPKQVLEKINEYYHEYPSCSGRSVHKLATQATISVDEARARVQKLLNAGQPNEVVFLKNATEGINLLANSLPFATGDRILITDREHNSNLVPWLVLQNRVGIKLETVPSNPDNTFDLETFEAMMGQDVRLVSMVHTSNLDGYTIPEDEIIKIAHDHDAQVLLDGAQSAPHKALDVQKMDVDFFVLSIHKMCGPTGVGALYGKYPLLVNLTPFLVGGGTVNSANNDDITFLPPPDRFEAGLQNYAGIIGAGAAAEYLMEIGLDNISAHDVKLNRIMTDRLQHIGGLELIGPADPELRGPVFSFNIKGIEPHNIAMILDETENILIRSGMQCMHSWFHKNNLTGSARASVYLYNTEDEVRLFSEKVIEIIENFK